MKIYKPNLIERGKNHGHQWSDKSNIRVPVYLKTSLLFITAILFAGYSLFADGLTTIAGTGSAIIKNSSVFSNVATTTTSIDVTNIDEVLVIASFEVERTQAAVSRIVYFRITDDYSTPNISGEIMRTLELGSEGGLGIGSLVYVFDVSGITGSISYSIQHKNPASQNITTNASIVAMALNTAATPYSALNSNMEYLSSGSTTSSTDYVGITGLTTDGILLPATGGMMVAASINCQKTVEETSSDAGTWILQQKKGINGTWGNVGSGVQRSMSTTSDAGIVTLYYFTEDQPRDYYYYRVAQKVSVGTGVTIETMTNSTIAAVALSYVKSNVGYQFKIETTSGSGDTESASAVNAITPITAIPTGSNALVLAQFAIACTTAAVPTYNLNTTTGTSISGFEEQRTISGASDKGAGGIVGLATSLSGSTEFSLQHRTTAGLLTTSNIQLGVLNLTDSPSPGYWEGDVSTDWHDGDNWSSGAEPLSTTNVTILDYTDEPIITSTAGVCNDLVIAPNASLTATAAAVTVSGTLYIESSASGSGSFIGSGTPTARVQRYITQNEWHLVTPITIPTTAYDFYLGAVNLSWLAELNETTNVYDYITDENASLSRGKGYSYWILDAQGAQTIEFTGTLIDEDVVAPLTKNNYGWNLIGNPFPSALNWATVTAGNTTGIAYVWDNSLSGYLYSTGGSTGGIFVGTLPNNIIPLGQGFLVQASTAGNFTIPEASRTHNTADFIKSVNDNKDEITQFIRIDLDGGYYGNTVFVGFPENGTANFDISADATKLYSSTENIQFFAVENDDELCINANAPLIEGESKTVPLNLVQVTDGSYTMEFSDLDQLQNTEITLEDIKTGTTQDIRENPVYTFNASNIDNPERFLLHFAWAPNGIEDIKDASSNMQIYSFGNEIYIRSKDEAINQGGDVFVYDLVGRELFQHRITGSELIKFPVNISNSYIVVKVVKQSSTKIQKIFIK